MISSEDLLKPTLSELKLQFLHPGLGHHVHQGIRKSTRSVLPDIDHFSLVRHDGRIFPDRIDSREDELNLVVSEGSSGYGKVFTFSSYSCITSAAMISLSLTNIWNALVKVDILKGNSGQDHEAELRVKHAYLNPYKGHKHQHPNPVGSVRDSPH